MYDRRMARARTAERDAAPVSIKTQLATLKRDAILDAATALFARRGYHGCSMDAIAEALGVTKPFIYYQFRDKAEILAAVCRKGADLTLSAVGEAESLKASHEARLSYFCERLADIVIAHRNYLMVYMREMGNLTDEHRHTIAHIRDEIDHRLAILIAAGVKAGEFDVPEPLIAARAVTGMLSFIYMWHRDIDVMPDEQLGRTMAAIAMRTLYRPAREAAAAAPRRRRVQA